MEQVEQVKELEILRITIVQLGFTEQHKKSEILRITTIRMEPGEVQGKSGIRLIMMNTKCLKRKTNNMKLWTIHCPRCNVLAKKLANKKIEVEVIDDKERMVTEGLDLMPLLELDDGTRLGFSDAVKWIDQH
jgi:hypothetical protein